LCIKVLSTIDIPYPCAIAALEHNGLVASTATRVLDNLLISFYPVH
jgi:hypothetical protein